MRGGALFLALQDLGPLSSMYRFSSHWFRKVFASALHDVRRTALDKNPEKGSMELGRLVNYFTQQVTETGFRSILCGLQQQHRQVFALLVTVHVLLQKSQDPQTAAQLWHAFIQAPRHGKSGSESKELSAASHALLVDIFSEAVVQGGTNTSRLSWLVDTGVTKPSYTWLSDKQWQQIVYLDTNIKTVFRGICLHLLTHQGFWERWMKCNMQEISWELSEEEESEHRATTSRTDESTTFSLAHLTHLAQITIVRILRPRDLLSFFSGLLPSVLKLTSLPSPYALSEIVDMFDNTVPIVLVLAKG